MASDLFRKQIAYIANQQDLSPDEIAAACIGILAQGLDQLMDEIQAVKQLVIVVHERTRRGLLR